MTVHVTGWDAADHLDSKEAVLAYLEAVFEDGDAALIAAALNEVARVKSVADNPEITTGTDVAAVVRTTKALRLEMTAKAA